MQRSLRGLRLSTRLGLAFTGILVLAAAAQSILYVRTQNETLEEAHASYQVLAEAIEVAAMQVGPGGWKDARVLADYRERLREKGLRDIKVTSGGREVPETVPQKGTKGQRQPGIRDVVISGVVGQGITNRMLQIPLVIEGRLLGYIQIYYSLENIRAQLADTFRRRLYALVAVFLLGLAVLLVITRNATRPIEAVADAASRVADGDLDVRIEVDREDEIGRLASSFNRMTESLRERQELVSRLQAAERRAEMGHLASGLAHEIRNPLNALSLGLDVLRRRHRPQEEGAAADYAARIEKLREEIGRLARLINNFLAFGRPLTLSLGPVDLGSLVTGTLNELAETAGRAGVTLESRIPDDLLAVRADGSLLKSAVWNLVQNAIQALEATGGTVRVALSRDLVEGREAVRATVEDTGPGIDPAHLPRLFEPYFSTKEGGVGLGLAMVRRIVEEHGGRVVAGNREDGVRGASFRLTIPSAV